MRTAERLCDHSQASKARGGARPEALCRAALARQRKIGRSTLVPMPTLGRSPDIRVMSSRTQRRSLRPHGAGGLSHGRQLSKGAFANADDSDHLVLPSRQSGTVPDLARISLGSRGVPRRELRLAHMPRRVCADGSFVGSATLAAWARFGVAFSYDEASETASLVE